MEDSFSHRKRKGVDVSAGPARKRKGDVIDTPPILTGNAPSGSGLCKDVDVSQGPPQKRKGDVMQIHDVINTPPILGENVPSSSRQGTHVRYPMHDLNPDCTSKNPNLTIIFFPGIDDDWKQKWTTRPMDDKEECICWPQMWIPKDLNDNVKILSLSYDSNVVTSVHNDVTEIGRNLIQSFVINSRCDNFLIYRHLIFHCVFQLKIIACILASLNKLFM
jgi:hypothetical protein